MKAPIPFSTRAGAVMTQLAELTEVSPNCRSVEKSLLLFALLKMRKCCLAPIAQAALQHPRSRQHSFNCSSHVDTDTTDNRRQHHASVRAAASPLWPCETTSGLFSWERFWSALSRRVGEYSQVSGFLLRHAVAAASKDADWSNYSQTAGMGCFKTDPQEVRPEV